MPVYERPAFYYIIGMSKGAVTMLRHKKEMKQHHLAEFHKKLEDIDRKFREKIHAMPASLKEYFSTYSDL